VILLPNYPDSLRDAWDYVSVRFVNFIPEFVFAVIVLVLGWVIATWLAKIVKSLLQSAKVDELGDKVGLQQVSTRTGMRLTISGAIAWLIKWFALIVIFLAAADILGLDQISDFLNRVLLYIPNVIAAAAILLVGSLVARFLSRLVRHSVAAAGLASADLLGAITSWSIMIFAVLATLDQLKVAQAFVQTLFTGIVVMIAIAGGLAFGLGGREHATRVLDKIEKDIKSYFLPNKKSRTTTVRDFFVKKILKKVRAPSVFGWSPAECLVAERAGGILHACSWLEHVRPRSANV
jgi:hypothetical protein